MTLPFYPSPGPETVINEPGHYKGYFCNREPSAPQYAFKPAVDWKIDAWSNATFGGHGCCYNCYVVLVELTYTGIDIPEPKEENKTLMLIVLVIIALLFGVI